MANMLMGVFSNVDDANNAISALQTQGFEMDKISVVARESIRSQLTSVESVGDSVGGGLAKGAVVGGLAGLLVGLAAITVPVLGGLLIAGPLAAALGFTGSAAAGAATGVLAGGLIGALVNLGFSEDEAKVYEERIKNDGILVAVDTSEGSQSSVENIFVDNNADEIRTKIGQSI